MRKRHFTLVEIMIVVAIIGLLAAIAIPSFMQARQTSQQNACINNLRQIEGAQEQWMLENNANDLTGALIGDIGAYLRDPAPTCPGGGTIYNLVDDAGPDCPDNIAGHAL